MNDLKLVKWLFLLLLFPIGLALFSKEQFRYPCQDPANWDKDFCKLPKCDVTRTCPEHVFKGQRDPRQGPPKDDTNFKAPATSATCQPIVQGANCGK